MGTKISIRMPDVREYEACESEFIIKSDESYFENKSFRNQNLGMRLQHIEFNGCEFVDCDFMAAKMDHVHFVDCRFHHCELTNNEFEECGFHRCVISNSKLTGTSFERCRLENVLFEDVMGRYMNFAYANLGNVMFRNSAMLDSLMSETKLRNVGFEHTDLSGLEVLHTPLKGIDFTDANINQMRLSKDDMVGMIVDEYQAVMLISVLGVIVK